MLEIFGGGEVELGSISSALERLAPGPDDKRSRPAPRTNVMMFFSSKFFAEDRSNAATPFIDLFASAAPTRFFILVQDDSMMEGASVTALCSRTTDGTPVCSEVVTLKYSAADSERLMSILRSHFVSGAKLELFLPEPQISLAGLERIVAKMNTIYLDSRGFPEIRTFHSRFGDLLDRVVDLAWLGLSPWRELCRIFFSHAGAAALLGRMRSCTVSGPDIDAGLFSGWLLSRLGLDPSSSGKEGIECLRRDHAKVILSRTRMERLSEMVLVGGPEGEYVRFFRPDEQSGTLVGQFFEAGRTRISEGNEEGNERSGGGERTGGRSLPGDIQIAGNIQGSASYQVRVPADDATPEKLLRNYFVVGESTGNYAASVRTALELECLRDAFFTDGQEYGLIY